MHKIYPIAPCYKSKYQNLHDIVLITTINYTQGLIYSNKVTALSFLIGSNTIYQANKNEEDCCRAHLPPFTSTSTLAQARGWKCILNFHFRKHYQIVLCKDKWCFFRGTLWWNLWISPTLDRPQEIWRTLRGVCPLVANTLLVLGTPTG